MSISLPLMIVTGDYNPWEKCTITVKNREKDKKA
jgi:hypothetical protein